MRLFLLTVLALMIGVGFTAELNNSKSGKPFYNMATDPRMAAPPAVSIIMERLGPIRLASLPDAERRRLALEEFSRDVKRMRWTDAGELEWDDSKIPSPQSSPP
jgi:hypothetical protein